MGGFKITVDGNISHEIKLHLLLGRKAMTNLDSILKKQRHYFADKGLSSQSCGFFNSHVWMWELDHKDWALKNCCFWTMVLDKTLESALGSKEIKPVNPKGNEPSIPPDVKNWLIGNDPDAGKDWRQEKGMTEDGLVGWHHWLDEHECGQALGVGERQGSLVCCSPWGHKDLDMTEPLNWIELMLG